jgi:hypothetical protein
VCECVVHERVFDCVCVGVFVSVIVCVCGCVCLCVCGYIILENRLRNIFAAQEQTYIQTDTHTLTYIREMTLK